MFVSSSNSIFKLIGKAIIRSKILPTFQIEAPIQLQRAVEALRMLSMDELKQVDRTVSTYAPFGAEVGEQFFADTLAIAGTRNSVALLVQKIIEGKIRTPKSAQVLASLQGSPAPSFAILQSIQKLALSEVVQKSGQLKQSAWLLFGALLNELCAHKESKIEYSRCPNNKKLMYMKVS